MLAQDGGGAPAPPSSEWRNPRYDLIEGRAQACLNHVEPRQARGR
jgi:hypothetical protein